MCYLLVFQRSTAFYLQSHTTGFHGTKQLYAAANVGFRTRLLRTLPKQLFFSCCFFLPDKTHLVYLIISAIWVPAFENGLALSVELIEGQIRKKGSLLKCQGLEHRIRKIDKRQRERWRRQAMHKNFLLIEYSDENCALWRVRFWQMRVIIAYSSGL